MNRRISGLLVCVIFFCAALTVAAQQALAPNERVRIVSISGDLKAFLGQMPTNFDVTIGFEIDPMHPQSRVSFEVMDATFADIMNAVVKSTPEYQWREVGKAVEIYPASGTNPILDLTVNSFHVKDVVAVAALNQLFGLNAVQDALQNSKLKLEPGSITPPVNPGRLVTIDLERVKLRDVLSRIATDSGFKFWTFQLSGARREFLKISFVRE